MFYNLACDGVPVRVVWRKRVHRCQGKAGETTTFGEIHQLVAPRGRFISRATVKALTQWHSHDIAVLALADMLGIAWNTVWHATTPAI